MRKNSQVQVDADKKHKILTDPDFINAPSYGNSLKRVQASHPEGVPEDDVAKYLLLSKEEIHAIHEAACLKIREYLSN